MPQSAIGLCAILASLMASACVTAPDVVRPPDYGPIDSQPSARAKLYADCIAQSAASAGYGYAFDGLHVVVFTCVGAPARAFFDALGPWTKDAGSEVVIGDRVIRPTTRVERDLFAVDYCEQSAGAVTCSITLRTGEFARP